MDRDDIIRNNLEEILNKSGDLSELSDDVDLKDVAPTQPSQYIEIKSKLEKKASRTVNSLLKFYLSEDFINHSEYAKCKVELGKLNLTGLLFQMKIGEKSIMKLMETIDSGDIHPRMFEVLGGLQRSYLDILEMQTKYMIHMEEDMKKLKNDFDVYGNKKGLSFAEDIEPEEDNTYRGFKGILKEIQEDSEDDEDE